MRRIVFFGILIASAYASGFAWPVMAGLTVVAGGLGGSFAVMALVDALGRRKIGGSLGGDQVAAVFPVQRLTAMYVNETSPVREADTRGLGNRRVRPLYSRGYCWEIDDYSRLSPCW